jgi:hypothetical protein
MERINKCTTTHARYHSIFVYSHPSTTQILYLWNRRIFSFHLFLVIFYLFNRFPQNTVVEKVESFKKIVDYSSVVCPFFTVESRAVTRASPLTKLIFSTTCKDVHNCVYLCVLSFFPSTSIKRSFKRLFMEFYKESPEIHVAKIFNPFDLTLVLMNCCCYFSSTICCVSAARRLPCN